MAFVMPLPRSALPVGGYYRGLQVAGRWAGSRPIGRGSGMACLRSAPLRRAFDRYLGFAERVVY